ncbi:site-specific integrase [Vibrio amylolyticus]|uniref:site-specific integrase n=1 Tax=Vibrio amylolyticus TaxID=2847292 RepID=UPI0035546BAD
MIVLDLLNKKTIRQIRRIDAENIRQELKLFPINSKKHIEFQGLNNRQIVSSNRTVNRECLSESSIKDYVQKASSFFEWCNQNEYTDINPFKGIRFRKTAKDNSAKQHYTYDQLTKIFTHEGFTKKAFKYDYQFWLPFLGYYTGARLNELCQLYRDDVIQIDDLWCLHIRSTREDQRLKNINSERIIPLHSKLIEMGFVEFATKSDTRRVFDELSLKRDGYGTVASKWFGRFKKSLRFTKGHDFHSFRHTFATQLKHSSINVHTAADLLGHTCSNISYERYGKSQKISLLKAAIEEIEPILLKK